MPWYDGLNIDSAAFEIAQSAEHRIRVLAGPGAGKSFAMKRRVARLLEDEGERLAIELQHSTIGIEDIEKRAFCYAKMGLTQIWVPFLRPAIIDEAETVEDGTLLLKTFSPRPFEKWVHGLNGKRGMWMYSPSDHSWWLAHLAAHKIHVPASEWYEHGEERSAGGYSRFSKRYRQLRLKGPHQLEELKLTVHKRARFGTDRYKWPAGKIASLALREQP